LVSMSVIALAFATYLGQVIPGLPAHIVAAAGVLAITGLNLFGIHLTSRVLIGLLAVVVALLALYGAAALHAVDAGHLAPILGNKGALGVAAGAAIFFWTWDGFMRMAIMAGEVKQPRRTIPIAIGGGVAIAAVIFVGTGAITLGVLGADEIGRQDTPMLAAAQKATGQWGSWVILAAAIVAALAEILGDLLSASRVVLPMAEARELPPWLGKIHAFHFHDCRHHFAGWFMMRGVSLLALKEILGHATLAMTMRYAHLAPEHLRSQVIKTERPALQFQRKIQRDRLISSWECLGSTRRNWSRGRELNPRPTDYESVALPLSYPGVSWAAAAA